MTHFTVNCTHCDTAFPVDPEKVPDEGVRARCTNCEGIFFVAKPAPEAEAAAAEPTDEGSMAETAGWAAAATAAATAVIDQADESVDEIEESVHEVEAAVEEVGAAVEEVEAAVEEVEAPQDEVIEPAGFDDAFDDDPFGAVEVEEPAVDDDAFGAFDDGFGDVALDEGPTDEEPATETEAEDSEAPSAGADDWVIETEETFDSAPPLEVAPLDTVEAQVRGFQEETFESPPEEGIGRVIPGEEDAEFSGYAGLPAIEDAEADEDTASDHEAGADIEADIAAPEFEAPAEESEDGAAALEAAEAAPAAPEAESAPAAPSAFKFGRRDPHEKAKRLARVLVSDMITYNADRHSRALEAGTIPKDFEEEISKSWTEYVDQVGAEMAESTDYWTDALNEVLAKGEKLF